MPEAFDRDCALFRNALCILESLDQDALVEAGVLDRHDHDAWAFFRDHPFRAYRALDDERQRRCFGLAQERLPVELRAEIIRCADHVYHRPTKETWVVAFADYERGDLAWCGWPDGLARISDCVRIKVATDEEHRELVGRVAASGGMRAAGVRRLYGAVLADRVPA